MNKQEFLSRLRTGLCGVSKGEREERLTFYSEMIDDRIEEGLSEEEAVAAVGTVEDVLAQVDIEKGATQQINLSDGKKRNVFAATLLILGSPVWVSLFIAAFAVVLSLYVAVWAGVIVSLWAIVVSLWAAFFSFVAGGFGGVIYGVVLICMGNTLTGIVFIAGAFACAGLAVFTFLGCKVLTKASLFITVKTAKLSVMPFRKKEGK